LIALSCGWATFAAANRATLAATPIHRMGKCVLMALSLKAIVSFKPETSTPANLLSFAEQEATRQLRRLSAAPRPGSDRRCTTRQWHPCVGDHRQPYVCATTISSHLQRGCVTKFISPYSDGNPMHKSRAQVKDGVLCRDTQDPQRFFLIAEWSDIEEHARIRKVLANEIKPEFIKYI